MAGEESPLISLLMELGKATEEVVELITHSHEWGTDDDGATEDLCLVCGIDGRA